AGPATSTGPAVATARQGRRTSRPRSVAYRCSNRRAIGDSRGGAVDRPKRTIASAGVTVRATSREARTASRYANATGRTNAPVTPPSAKNGTTDVTTTAVATRSRPRVSLATAVI